MNVSRRSCERNPDDVWSSRLDIDRLAAGGQVSAPNPSEASRRPPFSTNGLDEEEGDERRTRHAEAKVLDRAAGSREPTRLSGAERAARTRPRCRVGRGTGALASGSR